jgi:hypothetical protein
MSAHFEVSQTDADQPWHVRVVGANHEPVLIGENLADFDSARTAILAVAAMFVPAPDLRGDPFADAGDWFVSAGGHPTGARVRYVDERVSPEPPC